MQLKKRHIKIIVGNDYKKVFESKQAPGFLRIDFEIKKYSNTSTYGMNTANIELYNLNEESNRMLVGKELPVIIEAGYEGSEAIIFNGRIGSSVKIKKSPEHPDIVTNLLCAAGFKTVQHYVVSRAVKNMEIKDFLKSICSNVEIIDENLQKVKAPITADFVVDLNGNQIQGNTGERTFDDTFVDVLTKLSNEFYFDFQIGEDKVLFRPREMQTKHTITPDNGLIGIPEITELGVDLRTFFNPGLETGDAFTLESKYSNFKLGALEFLDRTDVSGMFNARKVNNKNRYAGSYRILELIHKCSSNTNDWQTEITASNYKLNDMTVRKQ